MPRLVVAHFRWFTLAWWDLNSTARFERPVSLVWANRINRTIWKNHSAIALRLSLLSLLSLLYLKQKLTNAKMALRVSDFIVQEQFLALALLYAFLVRCSDQIKGGFGRTLGFLWRYCKAVWVRRFCNSTSRVSSPVSVLICVDLVLFVVWPSLAVLYRAFVLFEA